VHRPLGQQHQNGGADVATAAARTVSAAPPTALAGAEAESAGAETPTEAGSETRTETRTETRAERPVVAGIVTAGKVAELATGLPALLVQCTPSMGVEAEALCPGSTGERSLYMGEWVVHVFSRFWSGSAGCATDTMTIYRKLS
jgi:hypothetical protein